jgi:DNA-binding LacI/PurR family transcriptional regulator
MSSIVEIIAKELNISTASVSRALNDRPGVGEELRVRILEKARQMNYAPSATARGLATSKTFALGFFVHEKPGLPAQNDPFYSRIMRGAEQALADSEYHLTFATITDDILNNPEQFRFTRQRRIDGMILAGPDISPGFVLAMSRLNMPVVLVDNQLEHSLAHSISSDDEGGAYRATRHLIERGHHHIGILSGPTYWPSNRRRVQGYSRALSEAGLPNPTVYADLTTIESGAEAFEKLLAQVPDITAICAVNDSMAIGAIRAARAHGMNTPEHLSVVGFDDIDWAAHNDPPLTTVHIPKRQMGAEAARRLLALSADSNLAPTDLIIAVQLIERASTAPIKA